MSKAKVTSSKAIWPILLFYLLFVLVGMFGKLVSPTPTVLNGFDFLVEEWYWIVLPLSVMISYLVLHVFYGHPDFSEQVLFVKVFFYFVSVVFVAWGLFGGLYIVNTLPSKSQSYVLKGEAVDWYKKYPANFSLKNGYHHIRYFVTVVESDSRKNIKLELAEPLYDSLVFQLNTPKLMQDKTTQKMILTKSRAIRIDLKKGWCGTLY